MNSLRKQLSIAVKVISLVLMGLLLIQQFPLNNFSLFPGEQGTVCYINGNGCSCKGAVCMCRLHKGKKSENKSAGPRLSPCQNHHTDSTVLTFSISRTLFAMANSFDSYLRASPISILNPLPHTFFLTTDLLRPPQMG